MAIYNVGSVNTDQVISVRVLVKPGETIVADSYNLMIGGKGANNQSQRRLQGQRSFI